MRKIILDISLLTDLYRQHKSLDAVGAIIGVSRHVVWKRLRENNEDMDRRNDLSDFWKQIEKGGPNDCWIWKGPVQTGGYGRFGYKGVHYSTHRLAYILANGKIPKGMHVCHKCDNPPCCNPAHLFLGSRSDNRIDCVLKGRDPKAKLNPQKVLEIRSLRVNGMSTRNIAKQINISRWVVKDVLDGKKWNYIK